MKKYNISGKEYTFYRGYQQDEELRHSFDELVKKIYKMSFESWYAQGYWQDKCVPYTLFNEGIAVANIFANIFDIEIFGKQKRYIQLGTVMTDKAYRKCGLSRFIMKKIIDEWREKSDAIYLYANNTVLDFYPKFGFVKACEYEHSMPLTQKAGSVRKLDMANADERKMLYEKCERDTPFLATPIPNGADVVMFHATMFLADCVYYVEVFDAIVVAKNKGETLVCYGVFCRADKPLCRILEIVAGSSTTSVVFGFTLKDARMCQVSTHFEEDATLFVLESKENIFADNKIMLPLISHT